MKKLTLILGLLLFCSQSVLADEAAPAQDFNDNRAVVSIQKQPAGDNQQQKVKNNWFCIVIQINGKAVDEQRVDEPSGADTAPLPS